VKNGGGTPGWFWPGVIILVTLSWIPLAFLAKNRVSRSGKPRFQVVPDMDQQPKFEAQEANPLFADGRAMRPVVPGTVARGTLDENDVLGRGKENGAWATSIPLPVTRTFIERGRRRYDIFCAPCHGLDGSGRGTVSVRAERLGEGTWTPPSSYHTDLVRGRPVGHIFNTITNGLRSMPAYGPQIPVADRWAIVAYVRALQRSQNASIADVPEEIRTRLR